MNWTKFFELAYTWLIGFETGFILDLIRQLLRVDSKGAVEGCPLSFLLAGRK